MHKNFGKSAFLISKPLQLMIALCIAQQIAFKSKPIFFIVDAFSGAQEVAKKLSTEFTILQTPKYFPSRELALNHIKKIKFDSIFIDSDVGFNNFLSLASLKFNNQKIVIHVYEEGLGTYRTDLYSGLKKKLLNFIGAGSYFGACRFVNKIYVFNTREYIEKIPSNSFKAQKIQVSLYEFLTNNRIAFNRLFEFQGIKPSSSNIFSCSLYLSNWKIDKGFISKFQKLEGDLFVKPHPHLRGKLPEEGIQSIDAQVPAELILIDLIKNYLLVHVYDHNSSVRRYVKNNNLKFTLVDL